MSNFSKEREELVELFGVHFENVHNLPPLGSRIFATLILDSCENMITFEDLVERMGASKSSVSTNLNLLLKLGKISYYTVPGDRKKYYKPTHFSERFDNYLKMMAAEKLLIAKMFDYREKTAACVYSKSEIAKLKIYEKHIDEMERVLLNTISDFKNIEKNDPI